MTPDPASQVAENVRTQPYGYASSNPNSRMDPDGRADLVVAGSETIFVYPPSGWTPAELQQAMKNFLLTWSAARAAFSAVGAHVLEAVPIAAARASLVLAVLLPSNEFEDCSHSGCGYIESRMNSLPAGVTNREFGNAVGWPGPKDPKGKGPDWTKMAKLGITAKAIADAIQEYQARNISQEMNSILYRRIQYLTDLLTQMGGR